MASLSSTSDTEPEDMDVVKIEGDLISSIDYSDLESSQISWIIY